MDLVDLVQELKVNPKKWIEKEVELDGTRYRLFASIKYYRKWFFMKEQHTIFIELKEK